MQENKIIRKKVLFSSKAPYANRIEAYLGKSRGNLARTIAPKPAKKRAPVVPSQPSIMQKTLDGARKNNYAGGFWMK